MYGVKVARNGPVVFNKPLSVEDLYTCVAAMDDAGESIVHTPPSSKPYSVVICAGYKAAVFHGACFGRDDVEAVPETVDPSMNYEMRLNDAEWIMKADRSVRMWNMLNMKGDGDSVWGAWLSIPYTLPEDGYLPPHAQNYVAGSFRQNTLGTMR